MKKLTYSIAIVLLTLVPLLMLSSTAHAALANPASISTTEGGGQVSLAVGPTVDGKYGDTILMLVVPDKYTDLGRGPGASQTLKAVHDAVRWRVQETFDFGGSQMYNDVFTFQVKAVDDDEVQGIHTSKIEIGYRCDTDQSLYPSHITRATVINTITDNDSPGAVQGGPIQAIGSGNPCMLPATAGTLGQGDKNQPTPVSATPIDTKSADYDVDDQKKTEQLPDLLNDVEAYTSGAGYTVWLKPDEKVRFRIGAGSEDHTITIKSANDDAATVVIASEPITADLVKGKKQQFDVDRDGKEDIAITLIGYMDEQAGLEVKPLTEAAKVSTAVTPEEADSEPADNAGAPLWPFFVGGLIAAGALVFAVRKGWLVLPKRKPAVEPTTKNKK